MAKRQETIRLFTTYTTKGCREFDHEKGTMRTVNMECVQEFTTKVKANESQRMAYHRLMAHAGGWIDQDKANNENHVNHTLVDWHETKEV